MIIMINVHARQFQNCVLVVVGGRTVRYINIESISTLSYAASRILTRLHTQFKPIKLKQFYELVKAK